MRMRVLFATDGRGPAIAASELLRRLAAPDRVDVTVLHADEYGNKIVADRYAEEVLGRAREKLTASGFDAMPVRAHDNVVRSIEKLNAEDPFALTVVGAGNHTWLGRLIFGSVSTHLVHHSTMPVLVVHRAPEPPHARLKVLIGVDGSASAACAIETLISMTEPHLVEPWIMGVVPAPHVTAMLYPGGPYLPPELTQERISDAWDAARRHVRDAIERFRSSGFEADGRVDTGPPAVVLLDEAADLDADVVVVGARGLDPMTRLTVGSVSAHVARHAPATLVGRSGDR